MSELAPQTSSPPEPRPSLLPIFSRLVLPLCLLVGAVFALGLHRHWPSFNGPWYWAWPWRDAPLVGKAALALAPGGLMILGALWAFEHGKWNPRVLLPILALACFALQLGGVLIEPGGLGFLERLVRSPVTTSYFTDALRIGGVRAWLSTFPPQGLSLHSHTHPPGPILYFWLFIRLFGAARAPLWGAIGIAALATMGIAFLGHRALAGRRTAAIGLGVLLFVATFFAWNLLTLSVLLLGIALIVRPGTRHQAAEGLVWAAITALGILTALALACGYDPLRTLLYGIHHQRTQMDPFLTRPWSSTVLHDPLDLLRGLGWITLPLLFAHARRVLSSPRNPALRYSWVALLQLLAVDLSGLLRAETARVWIFLMPLFLAPAAVELTARSKRETIVFFLAAWGCLVMMKGEIAFLGT